MRVDKTPPRGKPGKSRAVGAQIAIGAAVVKPILWSVPVGTATLMATLFGIWDIWLQTTPNVQPPALSDKVDVLPFAVNNPSHFFTMYETKIIFNVLDPDPEAIGGVYHTFDVAAATGKFNIAPLSYSTITLSFPFNKSEALTHQELADKFARLREAIVNLSVCYEQGFGF